MTMPVDGSGRRTRPVFAALYAGFARVADRVALARLRSAVLAEASGALLVVGAGQGHDLAHLPPAVTSVVAVEPDAAMRRRARGRVRAARVPVRLVAGTAERLPVADRAVDTVLCMFVLCSVDDLGAAVAEIRRVLRPDGRLLLLEHVRGRGGSRTAALQDTLDPVWARLAGGCHLDRRTGAALDAAGFDTHRLAATAVRGVPLFPLLTGVARPPGGGAVRPGPDR